MNRGPAMLRRYDCGHLEFTGKSWHSNSIWSSFPLGTAGPCQQCRADGMPSASPFDWGKNAPSVGAIQEEINRILNRQDDDDVL